LGLDPVGRAVNSHGCQDGIGIDLRLVSLLLDLGCSFIIWEAKPGQEQPCESWASIVFLQVKPCDSHRVGWAVRPERL
jgi:hypothetical protein